MKKVEKRTFTTVTARTDSEDDASMTISTSRPDRDKDRVIAEGAELANFRKNPVLLFAHNHFSLPIGTVTAIDRRKNEIKASWRWLKDDEDAARVKNAWEQGVLRAASIGFAPIEWVGNDLGGFDFTKWELLEVSLVPVPANAEAVRMLKSLGLDISPSAKCARDDDVIFEIDLDDDEDGDTVYEIDTDELDISASTKERENLFEVDPGQVVEVIRDEFRRELRRAAGRID